jgi:hypothetical protein
MMNNYFKNGATLCSGWKKEMGQTRSSVPQISKDLVLGGDSLFGE